MNAPSLIGVVVMVALLACATTPPPPSPPSAWPPIVENFGGFITTGHGIIIHCHVSADPHIYYYTVKRSQGELFKGGAEVFLAGSLETKATPEGVSHLVMLGEFHSDAQLIFAMGATEATGPAAAVQFQSVLPPGADPERVSAGSKACVSHMATLLGSLSGG